MSTRTGFTGTFLLVLALQAAAGQAAAGRADLHLGPLLPSPGRAAARGEAVQIYVSPSGDDRHPGTKARPLATPAAALAGVREMRKGGQKETVMEIVLSPGTYLLKKPLELGPEDGPLIIRSSGPEKAVLSGGIPLPAFRPAEGGLWKIYLPEIARFGGSFGQLFVNGTRAVRARTPDQGQMFKTGKVSEWRADTSASRTGLAVQKIGLTTEQAAALEPLSSSELRNAIISVHHAWDLTRKPLQSYSEEEPAVFISGEAMKPWNKLDNHSQFYFENARAFLDAPGEWFLDPAGTLYYRPREEERIEDSRAIVPVLDQLLIVRGNEEQPVSNVCFEQIAFRYTRYLMPAGGDEPAQAAAPASAALMLDFARDIHFEDCEIAHTGNYAIWFRNACRESSLRRSYLHDLGMGGVKIGTLHTPEQMQEELTRNILVDNNIIRSGGFENPTGVGVIIFKASDNQISHNDISDFRYTGISVGWVWGYSFSPSKRNKIVYNHIHHLGWGELSDMGGVYTLGASEGTEVSHNVIHHVYSYGYGGWGLYTDEGSTGILMENNLVYRCKSSGFHQHYGKDNIIRNNIFALQLRAQLEATRVEDHRSFVFTNNIIYFDSGDLIGKPGWLKAKFDASRNCYWDTRTSGIRFMGHGMEEWRKLTGKDLNSIIADPGFADPGNYDFGLKHMRTARRIGFKPFDYSRAGVYGDEAWKALASFDPELEAKFDRVVGEMEARSAGTP